MADEFFFSLWKKRDFIRWFLPVGEQSRNWNEKRVYAFFQHFVLKMHNNAIDATNTTIKRFQSPHSCNYYFTNFEILSDCTVALYDVLKNSVHVHVLNAKNDLCEYEQKWIVGGVKWMDGME